MIKYEVKLTMKMHRYLQNKFSTRHSQKPPYLDTQKHLQLVLKEQPKIATYQNYVNVRKMFITCAQHFLAYSVIWNSLDDYLLTRYLQ